MRRNGHHLEVLMATKWLLVSISEAIEVMLLPMAMPGGRSELECNGVEGALPGMPHHSRMVVAGLLGGWRLAQCQLDLV
jgi:hypothetical protein